MHNDTLHNYNFLSGGGEMGERIRNFDWSQTSLGDPEHWDPSLKTCVRIMLTSQQPIWIGWGKDYIKLYNDPYKAIVGGKHPQALGQPAAVVWKEIWTHMEPLLRQVEKNEGTYSESQLLIMERNGYPEETYYTFSYSPIPGMDGKTAGMICYNTSDTARIVNARALETLRRLGSITNKNSVEEVYASAIGILGNGNRDFPFAIISVINEWCTTAELFTCAGIDKNHPGLPQNVDLKSRPEHLKYFVQAIEENSIVLLKTYPHWNLPTGTWDIAPLEMVHVPIRSGNHRHPVALLSLGLNPYRPFDAAYRNFVQLIADQLSLEVSNVMNYEEERMRAQALAEIDKAKTVFFSNISHEFRTPLTLMLGPLEELLNHPYGNLSSSERKNLDTSHRNALRLLKLVNSLLDFSRIEAGRQQARFSMVDLVSFTKNLASNFRSVIEHAGLELVIKADAIVKPVYVDPSMWEKIVFNLLSNAYKYTLNGKITVELLSGKNYAVLNVHDTGVGIPEDELPRMFERFHRVERTWGRTYEGTGIGLSMIKELVHLHNGIIQVESTLGKGSTFTVKIPYGKEHLSSQQILYAEKGRTAAATEVYPEQAELFIQHEPDVSQAPSTDHRLPTILVTDDNADMREHLKDLLSKKYNVVLAHNGLDALHKMRENLPDLVLSDVMMPIMDGFGLLKEIKNHPGTNHVPVIFLTARAGEESRIEGWNTGADDYLVKPFSAKELLSRVASQIQTQHIRKGTEARFKSILLQSPNLFAMLKGEEMFIDFVNQPMIDAWGKDWDIVGKPLLDAVPELKDQKIPGLLEQVYTTGQTHMCSEEMAILFKDGYPREVYFNYVYQPVFEPNGQVSGIAIMAIDITEQTLANKKMAAKDEDVNNLFEQTPVGIAVMRGETLIIELVNQAMLGYWDRTREQVMDKPIWEVLPEVRDQGFDQVLKNVYETGERFVSPETQVKILRKGQMETIYVTFALEPRRDIQGRINGLLAIANEVTELVMARGGKKVVK